MMADRDSFDVDLRDAEKAIGSAGSEIGNMRNSFDAVFEELEDAEERIGVLEGEVSDKEERIKELEEELEAATDE